MIIEFGEKALEDLYLTGSTDDKRYERLPKDIKKRFIKVVNILRSARRIEDLFFINSLHYEKKRGDLKDMEAVWINDKYRLIFKSSPDEQGIIVNALLIEISKHYE
jgi:proteic killer suppression protein